jgi:arabinan endo-1,5-alpha-L-arabinosidase
MKKGSMLLILCLGMLLTSCSPKEESVQMYQNPVFEPVLADPSIIKAKDGYFYAYGTEDDWGDQKGDRLIPIVRSRNLVDWKYVGPAFTKKPEWYSSGSLWAPDISYFNKKYYLYYALSIWGDTNPGIGVALSESPEGPFQDKGKLFDSKSIGVGNSIDPMLFVDDDKTAYLFWGSFHGIFGVKLSDDRLSVVGNPFQIAGNDFEASYIIKRSGYYYYFGSRGSCCEGANSGYNVAVGRSKHIMGPYVDKDGKNLLLGGGTLLLTGNFPGDKGEKLFSGPGHNAIIKDDEGTDWIVYHAVDRAKPFLPNGATRRPLMIDPIKWKNGWPEIVGMVPSNKKMPRPVINKK